MTVTIDVDRRAAESLPIAPVWAWTPPEFLLELMADDQTLLAELLEAFTTDTGARVQLLRASFSLQDFDEVRRSAHSVKGAARQLGAEEVATICQEIETKAGQQPTPPLREQVDQLEAVFHDTCQAMNLYHG